MAAAEATKETMGNRLNRFFRRNNWLIILMIPLSLIFDLSVSVIQRFKRLVNLLNGKESHDEKVKDVQRQVREWMRTDQSVPMCTSRPAWFSVSLQRQTYKSRFFKVNIDMADILELDEENCTVLVEPSVSMGQINEYLSRRGWTVAVVPELNELTMGGLVMGGGIETTAKRYGLFNDICLGYEMVLADASVVWCDRENHLELFLNIPFSYGTLGFLTAVKVQIVRFKPYLKMTYHPAESLESAMEMTKAATSDDRVDTVETLVFSKSKAVVMTGVFVEKPDPGTRPVINKVYRWYKPWFYLHVETFLRKDTSKDCFTEYIPTLHYYQRHVRPVFWLLQYYLGLGNNPLFRYLLGWALPLNFAMPKFINAMLFNEDLAFDGLVVQDYGLHIDDVAETILELDTDCGVYPIWLCPFVVKEERDFNGLKRYPGTIMVDIGVYGYTSVPGFDMFKFLKKYEKLCLDKHGGLAVYTKTFLSREEFEKLPFHVKDEYNLVRSKYNCEKAFPHVFDKISDKGRD